jgi:hypothetical protein
MAKTMANDAQLKEAVTAVASVMNLISDVASGAGLLKEGMDGLAVLRSISPVIKDASLMFPEYKAMDDAARADMDAFVASTVTYAANMQIQQVSQMVLDWVIMFSSFFSALAMGHAPAPAPAAPEVASPATPVAPVSSDPVTP